MRKEYRHSLILCKQVPTVASSAIREFWRALLKYARRLPAPKPQHFSKGSRRRFKGLRDYRPSILQKNGHAKLALIPAPVYLLSYYGSTSTALPGTRIRKWPS